MGPPDQWSIYFEPHKKVILTELAKIQAQVDGPTAGLTDPAIRQRVAEELNHLADKLKDLAKQLVQPGKDGCH
jgi:hypothetical protein